MQTGGSALPSPKNPVSSICALLSAVVPLLLAASRLSGVADWGDDLRVVESIGWVPISAGGSISSVLTQLATLLPIGGRLLRANLVNGLALAACGYLAFRVAERLLWRAAASRRLGPLLALSASLIATLSPAAQAQATALGSTALASAFALLALLVRPGRFADARVWLGLGAVLAAVISENQSIGALLFVALLAQLVCLAELPSRRELMSFLLGLVTFAGVCLLPILVRAHASRGGQDLGLDLTPQEPEVARLQASIDALRAWTKDTGILALLLAGVGAVLGMLKRRLRWLVAPLLVLVIADECFSSIHLFNISLGSFRILALVALSSLAALGVQGVVSLLRSQTLPFAEPASVLLVVFHLTLALVAIEGSDSVRHEASGAPTDAWTEEALGGLPPRSLVLVRNPVLVWRMWSARVIRGERPDVVVVPTPLLDRGSVAANLLELEPALAPLIREVSVNGTPSEDSLSSLADVRPLFVELDPRWDARLFEHLTPAPVWLRFAPQPQGRSDRARTLDTARSAFSRVLATIAPNDTSPESTTTLAVLGANTREQAVLLGALGDRDALAGVLDDIVRAPRDDDFAAEMKKRLAQRERGRVDVQGLLN